MLSQTFAKSREADLQAFRESSKKMSCEDLQALQGQVQRDMEAMKELIENGCTSSSQEVGCIARLTVLEMQSEILQKEQMSREKLK